MHRYPTDWPGEGPIDLGVHDLPHASSTTEWWYIHSHIQVADGRDFSLFASFFRICKGRDESTQEPVYAHSMTWALSDPQAGKYYPLSYVDPDAPKMGIERIKRGEGTKDDRLRRALREILELGHVPYPDQLFPREVYVGKRQLELDFGGQRFIKIGDSQYKLDLYHDHFYTGCELILELEKAPVRHGNRGVVKGTAGENMFYYFIPRCRVTGELIVNGVRCPVVKGHAWYDHEFGAPPTTNTASSAHQAPSNLVLSTKAGTSTSANRSGKTESGSHDAASTAAQTPPTREDVAWNWISVQLDNGAEISAYALFDRMKGDQDVGSFCVYIAPNGQSQTVTEFELVALNSWRSTRTFNEYPTQWTLKVPAWDCDIQAKASHNDQEFITLISKPAFWEGRISATGSCFGETVQGIGFLERSGFHDIDNLDDFFKAVSKETRQSVSRLLPLEPTYKQTRDLIADDTRDDLMEGVDPKYIAKYSTHPVREITDRGGKAWRSYAALACCDVVGGDSREYVHWLAMPELMHVGSLIVDDVQDKSTWRRGGKSCHVIYGEAVAINAGTACYFMGQKILVQGKKNERCPKSPYLRLLFSSPTRRTCRSSPRYCRSSCAFDGICGRNG